MITKDESKWDPIKIYMEGRWRSISGNTPEMIGGFGNVAKAIVLGLKYIGDCILDAKANNKT